MKLQEYVISKMCHSKDAAVWGLTKLNPSHFTGNGRKYYSIIKSLYKLYGGVDLHTFVSQSAAQRIQESNANEIYQYAQGQTDEWQNVFAEFKQESVKRLIRSDLQSLLDVTSNGHSVSEIASKTTSKAVNWISDAEKRYYTGEEIDNLSDEYGDPINTGYSLYDDMIYKYGGNLKGQMKGVICREKHGKTRSETWEIAQNIRQGHKVLYITMEGVKKDITGNIKQVLQSDWNTYRNNFLGVDGIVDIEEIESVILEAVLVEQVEKVVIDYIQLVIAPGDNENTRINTATERLRHLMVKYNFHLTLLSQARKESTYTSVPKDSQGNALVPKGWKHVPDVNDAYGSMSLIKAASIIIVGFRPNLYPENIEESELGARVINPNGDTDSIHSVYFKITRTRYKPELLHQWWKFTDGDTGLKNPIFL
jgi:KaiC/GvpD/RAD55 family RecA-like ATPase